MSFGFVTSASTCRHLCVDMSTLHVYDHFEVQRLIPATCFAERNRCKL